MVVLQHIPDDRSRRIRPKISIIGEGVVDRLRSHTLRGRGSFCDEFESEKLTKLGNVVFFCDIVMIHSIIQDVVQRWSFLFFSQGDDHMFSVVGFFGHSDVRIFGSVARKEAREDSDLDILIDLDPDRSLLDVGGLAMDLSLLLDRPVDVVTEAGLRERIRSRILREVRGL